MNVYSIPEIYPIGTKVRLSDDYPGIIHEVLGYEHFADYSNIVFKDGSKLNVNRLDLIAEVA